MGRFGALISAVVSVEGGFLGVLYDVLTYSVSLTRLASELASDVTTILPSSYYLVALPLSSCTARSYHSLVTRFPLFPYVGHCGMVSP
jgi:hypothetical protein